MIYKYVIFPTEIKLEHYPATEDTHPKYNIDEFDLILTCRGQGEDCGGEGGHAQLVSVGEVEGVVGRNVMELYIDATFGFADMTLDNADTVVSQKPAKLV